MNYHILHLLLFPHRHINCQDNLASSTCVIVVVKFDFTATHWIQITILYLIYVHIATCFCSTFEQMMVIHMHKCTDGHHRMVIETNKTINFPARFFFIVNKRIHIYNFSLIGKFSFWLIYAMICEVPDTLSKLPQRGVTFLE